MRSGKGGWNGVDWGGGLGENADHCTWTMIKKKDKKRKHTPRKKENNTYSQFKLKKPSIKWWN